MIVALVAALYLGAGTAWAGVAHPGLAPSVPADVVAAISGEAGWEARDAMNRVIPGARAARHVRHAASPSLSGLVTASPLVKKWAERSLRDSIGLFLGFLAREPFARMMSVATAWLPDLRRRLDQVRRMMTTSVAVMALTLMTAMSCLYWVMAMAGLSARPSPFYLLRTQRE